MPSQAPLITPGQHYTGNLSNRADDANFGGEVQVALWRLPPLIARDVLYVDWFAVPPQSLSLCLTFVQGIDDYNWGARFDAATWFECEAGGGPAYTRSGSGTARTAITVPETNAGSSFLEFYTSARETDPARFGLLPYVFTVHPPLHHLSVALKPVKRVSADGLFYATATLADGQPAPDGLGLNLAVTWPGGSATYASETLRGGAAFRLTLPRSAHGERATFVVSRPADGAYLEASSPSLRANVKEPGPTPCDLAKRRKLSLTRQLTRLNRRANQARGANRRDLRRRAHRTARKLRGAKGQVRALC